MTKENSEALDDSLDDAAEAIEEKAEAEKQVAQAVADQKSTEATHTIVAAAQGAASLAEVESAKAKQAAADTITQSEEKISWLGTQTESLSQQLKETQTATASALAELQAQSQKTAQALALLISAASTPKETAATDLTAMDKSADRDAQKAGEKKKRKITLI
jgi:hypothetical protein